MASQFDLSAAKKAGYSDDEILDYLSKSRGFDVSAALKLGRSKGQIIGQLAAEQETPATEGQAGPAARFTAALGKEINPVTMVKGLAQTAAHPIKTAKELGRAQMRLAEEGAEKIGEGDAWGAAAKFVAALIPILGPGASEAGEKLAAGDIAGGLGQTTGLGINVAATALSGKVKIPIGKEARAARMYQSALKPSTRLSMAESGRLVKTGLEEGLPVSVAGLEKLTDLVYDLNQKVSDQIQSFGAGKNISPSRVASRLDEVKRQFSKQVNPEADMAAVETVKEEFLRQSRVPGSTALRKLPAGEAQALKQGTYRQLERSYGELKSATKESQKALARGLKEELETVFPELRALNARESRLLNLEKPLEDAIQRAANRQIIGLGTPLAGGAVGVVTKSKLAASIAGITRQIVDSPTIKSRLAIALYRGSKGRLTLKTAKARVAAYLNALGQAEAAAPAGSSPPDETQTPQ